MDFALTYNDLLQEGQPPLQRPRGKKRKAESDRPPSEKKSRFSGVRGQERYQSFSGKSSLVMFLNEKISLRVTGDKRQDRKHLVSQKLLQERYKDFCTDKDLPVASPVNIGRYLRILGVQANVRVGAVGKQQRAYSGIAWKNEEVAESETPQRHPREVRSVKELEHVQTTKQQSSLRSTRIQKKPHITPHKKIASAGGRSGRKAEHPSTESNLLNLKFPNPADGKTTSQEVKVTECGRKTKCSIAKSGSINSYSSDLPENNNPSQCGNLSCSGRENEGCSDEYYQYLNSTELPDKEFPSPDGIKTEDTNGFVYQISLAEMNASCENSNPSTGHMDPYHQEKLDELKPEMNDGYEMRVKEEEFEYNMDIKNEVIEEDNINIKDEVIEEENSEHHHEDRIVTYNDGLLESSLFSGFPS